MERYARRRHLGLIYHKQIKSKELNSRKKTIK